MCETRDWVFSTPKCLESLWFKHHLRALGVVNDITWNIYMSRPAKYIIEQLNYRTMLFKQNAICPHDVIYEII